MKRFTVCIEDSLSERIDNYCEEHNVSRSRILSQAVAEYLTAMETLPSVRADFEKQLKDLADIINERFAELENKK